MEKFVVITYLYDFYHNLLTQKQKELLKDYYFEDLSLSEMAVKYDISRQSIFDTIKKAEQKLLDYEEKLQLFAKYQHNQQALLEIKKRCEALQPDLEPINEVITLINELLSKM